MSRAGRATTAAASAALTVAALTLGGCSGNDDVGPDAGPEAGGATPIADPGETTGAGTSGTPGSQQQVLAGIDGERRGGCVDTGEARDVRSGGLAAGPFDEVRAGWDAGSGTSRTVPFYLIPEHPGAMDGVVLTGRLVEGSQRFREKHRRTSRVEGFDFYDLDLTLPAAGTWRLRATAGRDVGCWTVEVG